VANGWLEIKLDRRRLEAGLIGLPDEITRTFATGKGGAEIPGA